MKLLRSAILCSMLLSAAWVQADPIVPTDPSMIVDRDEGFSIEILGLKFVFFANADGGGKLEFENKSGVDWLTLLVTTVLPAGTTFPDDYVFGGNAYTDVSAILEPSTNILSILFFDADFSGTILNNDHFTINLNNPGSTTEGGWGANHAFFAQANAQVTTLPAPGTLVLVLVGLGLLLTTRLLVGRLV